MKSLNRFNCFRFFIYIVIYCLPDLYFKIDLHNSNKSIIFVYTK